MVETKKRSLDPAVFFLIAGLLVGIFYCIVVPYGAGFDEERHLARIYYMSEYHFLPNFPDQIIHEDVFNLSYQRRLVQSPAFDMFNHETFLRRFSTFDELRYGQKTQSIYSPIIFLPQALIGRALWWMFDFPILPTIILQKIAGLLMYLAGAYFAIRVVPYGKWIFAALALSPAAMYQASTLNGDGFTAGISFAFIGWVLAVYENESDGIRPRSILMLIGLSLLLGSAKPGAIVLLPMLLILYKHHFPSRTWIVFLGVGVALAVAVHLGWWKLASQGSDFLDAEGQSIPAGTSMIVSDPFGFVKLLIQSMILTFPSLVQGWMAAYGYWAGTVPWLVYFFLTVLLLAALLVEYPRVTLPKKTRLLLIGFSIFCSVAIYTVVFSVAYHRGVYALIKQGRYFIPFAPLFFLGFTGLFKVHESVQKLLKQTVVVSFLLVTLFYSFGIYTTYYTYCGYNAYTGGKCILPIYKNLEKEDSRVTGINNGERVTQTFTNQCGSMEEVQVFVNSIPESSSGSLRFSLLDENHQVLASQNYPTNEVTPLDYLSLPVDLPPDYKISNFEIELESIDLPPFEKFRFNLTPGDYYPGQMTNEGIAAQGDLVIHYVCTTP